MAKKVYGMFFTGTGTTEKMVTYIAKELAKELGCDYEPYDFTLPAVRKTVKEYTADDIVVLGTPVIAGRVPNLLLKYLDTVVGNGAYGIPVVLYGNRNFDDALIELRNIMEATDSTQSPAVHLSVSILSQEHSDKAVPTKKIWLLPQHSFLKLQKRLKAETSTKSLLRLKAAHLSDLTTHRETETETVLTSVR